MLPTKEKSVSLEESHGMSYNANAVYLERSLEIIANLFHCMCEITVMHSACRHKIRS